MSSETCDSSCLSPKKKRSRLSQESSINQNIDHHKLPSHSKEIRHEPRDEPFRKEHDISYAMKKGNAHGHEKIMENLKTTCPNIKPEKKSSDKAENENPGDRPLDEAGRRKKKKKSSYHAVKVDQNKRRKRQRKNKKLLAVAQSLNSLQNHQNRPELLENSLYRKTSENCLKNAIGQGEKVIKSIVTFPNYENADKAVKKSLGVENRMENSLDNIADIRKTPEETREFVHAEWSETLANGLSEELRDEYSQEYCLTNEYEFLKAKLINPTLKKILGERIFKSDQAEVSRQRKIAAAIIAIDRVFNSILFRDEDTEEKFERMDCLIDGGRILADLNHSITMKRRRDLIGEFDREDLADFSPVKDFLLDPQILKYFRVERDKESNDKSEDDISAKEQSRGEKIKEKNDSGDKTTTKKNATENSENMERCESKKERTEKQSDVKIKEEVSESRIEEEMNEEEMEKIEKVEERMKKEKNTEENMEKKRNPVGRKEEEKNAGENIKKENRADKIIVKEDSGNNWNEEEIPVEKVEKKSVPKTELSPTTEHAELLDNFCRLIKICTSQNDGDAKFVLPVMLKAAIKRTTNTPAPDEQFPGIMEMVKRAYLARGVPEGAVETILKNLAPTTWHQYEKAARFWWDYCKQHTNVDVYDAETLQIFDFLVHHEDAIGNASSMSIWRAAMSRFTRHELAKCKELSEYVNGFKNLKK